MRIFVRGCTPVFKAAVFGVVAVILVVLAACAASDGGNGTAETKQQSVKLMLVYSANLDGELEPCGCSDEGNLGGIKRRGTALDDIRKQYPESVVISAGGLIKGEGGSDRIKSEFILKGMKLLSYDAFALQWQDLAFGFDFIKRHDLPWVSSNWLQDNVAREKIIERVVDGVNLRMAFVSWLNPADSPAKAMQGSHSPVDEDVAKLRSRLAGLKQQGMITLLATAMPLQAVQQKLDLANVDVLIIESAYEVYSEPVRQGETLVLQAGSRGMRLGKLLLQLRGDGIVSWQHEILPMPDKVADSPRLLDWYQAYNDKVKEDYEQRVAIRKQTESGQSPYVGEEVCAQCHAKQHEIWAATDHAVAYDDLERVNKAFDPNCLQCHVVGFEQKGGFFDLNLTGHLIGVQCENCHGAGREHVEAAGKKPLPNHDWSKPQVCGQCHTQPHSPGFALDKYWPKIAH